MSRFRDEINVIPRPARIAAAAVAVAVFLLLLNVALPHDQEMRHWPLWGGLLFSAGIACILCVYTLLIGYVAGDAKRRGMRRVLWVLICIFVPNGIGIILYFILRDPPLYPCPKCGTQAQGSFVFCPNCGGELHPACPQCKRAVGDGWKRCAYCGAALDSAPSGDSAQAVR